MNPTSKFFGAAGLCLLAAGSASAAVFASNPNGIWDDGGSYVTIGTKFTVGAEDVSIRALGLFDENGDGLERGEEVAVYSLDKTLLAKVSLQAGTGSAFHDGSRWESLATTLDLKANTSYMLAWSAHPNQVRMNVINYIGNVTIDPHFQVAGDGYFYSDTGIDGLNFPGQFERSAGLYAFGGNMELVPEPTAGVIIAAGLLGFAVWRRGRNR